MNTMRMIPVTMVAVLFVLIGKAGAGVPYSEQTYGQGWYGFGEAYLVLPSTNLVVPEGTSTQILIHLSTQPPRNQTVTVSRVSGDTDLAMSGASNIVLTTNNWNVDQSLVIAAVPDGDSLDGAALFHCVSLDVDNQGVQVLESDRTGTGDIDGDRMSNVGEYIAGTDWLDSRARLKTSISSTGVNVRVGFDALLAGTNYPGMTRHYRIQTCTSLVNAAWVPVPGQTNIVSGGPYTYITNTGERRFYRVGAWLTTP